MPAKASKSKIPATVTAAVVAGFTGITPQRVAQLAQEGKIPTPGKRGAFAFRGCVLAIVEELRGKNVAKPGAAAITRRQEAEAITAEVDAAAKVGTVMLKEDARLIWTDAVLETRRVIEEADFISASSKAKLFDRLAALKLAE